MHRTRTGIAVAAAVVLGWTRAASAEGSARPGACSLLPAAEVKKLAAPDDAFFDRFPPPDEEPLGPNGSACSYSSIHVQLNPFTPERLEALRKERGAAWTAVAGVGDAAYFHDNDRSEFARTGELYARSGGNVVTIQIDLDEGESAESALVAATALAKALIAKLR